MTREEAINHIMDILCENNTVKHSDMVVFENEKEALRMAVKLLEQEPCEDAISVPIRSLKYRAKNMVAYNVDWLKEHWQMEMDIVCGVKPCDDAISRDAVLKEFEKGTENLYGRIDKLPPVTQEPKTGHWIEHPEIKTSIPEYLMFYECSECGDKQCFYKSDINKKHFCNNCGARMESEE